MNLSIYDTLRVLLAFITFLKIGQAGIILEPKDTEAIIGETAIFNCSSSIHSAEIHWFYYDSKPNAGRSFVYGYDKFYPNYEGFRMEKNNVTGAYNLIIPSVAASNAGKYECQDDFGHGEKKSAHLIVLDGVPVCRSNTETYKVIGSNNCGIEPSQLALTCIVQYHGNEAPIMEWNKMGDNKPITEGVSYSNIGNQVILNLTMNGDSVKNGSSFNCHASRSKSNRASCSSGNVTVVGKFVAAEVFTCPDCKPYQDAIICIIVLPLAVSGIAVVLCLLLYKRKWNKRKENPHSSNEQEEPTVPLKRLKVFPIKLDCVVVSVCIFLIIFPIVNSGFLILAWYLLIYRPKRLMREAHKKEECSGGEKTQFPPAANKKEEIVGGEETQVKQTAHKKEELSAGEETQILLTEKKVDAEVQIETDQKKIKNKYAEKALKILREDNESKTKIIENLKENFKKLQTEMNLQKESFKQLTDKVKEIEHRLYPPENIDYTLNPSLAITINIHSESIESKKRESKRMSKMHENQKEIKSISGLTVLDNELFVLCTNYSDIQVYDSTTYQMKRKFTIPGNVIVSHDMVSCKPDHCIYIISQVKEEDCSQIFKLHPSRQALQLWSKSSSGKTGRLSVYETNLIVCLHEKQVINEYKGDGELINTVRLSPAIGLINPWHAIKTSSMHFIVSHGDVKDDLHRVCVVDLNGNVIKECSKWDKSGYKPYRELKVPIFLLEDDERSILVADRENRRILILNSVLKYQRKLIKEEHGLKDDPLRICFDETKTRLFVAVTSGCIVIFNIK